ncbi:hypothetical protein DFH07DRAFT_784874 [Mycena maculata]|uniref:Uncharacterized protein n=1 Tax=Mycena maculata TaxID=230809 RepID=A0AAD7HE77_9AGAR|nr:hypothetical protein DFH07DRAFT_784874 [Mycena maculata]
MYPLVLSHSPTPPQPYVSSSPLLHVLAYPLIRAPCPVPCRLSRGSCIPFYAMARHPAPVLIDYVGTGRRWHGGMWCMRPRGHVGGVCRDGVRGAGAHVDPGELLRERTCSQAVRGDGVLHVRGVAQRSARLLVGGLRTSAGWRCATRVWGLWVADWNPTSCMELLFLRKRWYYYMVDGKAGQYPTNMCIIFGQYLANTACSARMLAEHYLDNIWPIFGQYTLYWPDMGWREFASKSVSLKKLEGNSGFLEIHAICIQKAFFFTLPVAPPEPSEIHTYVVNAN